MDDFKLPISYGPDSKFVEKEINALRVRLRLLEAASAYPAYQNPFSFCTCDHQPDYTGIPHNHGCPERRK